MSSTVTSTAPTSAADTYVQMIDQSTPTTYASSCQDAAAQARRDSTAKTEQATKLRQQAEEFASKPGVGNQKTAVDLRTEAAKCEQDANDRLQWAGRLDEMASNAIAEAS